jgi:integrase
VFTGARLNEILKLRWDEVRLTESQLRLEDSKTGRKTIFLPPHATALLHSHSREDGNPFVIRGWKEKTHLVNLEKPWQRIRKAAGLQGVRLHDLRHTFASIALSGGYSLPTIGGLLGHRNASTTQRYAHLSNDTALQAAQATGVAIAVSFNGRALISDQ